MKKVFRTILLIALIIAGVVAGYRGIGRSTVSMDSLLTFCTAQNGGTIAAWNDGNSTVIARLKQNGTINGHLKFRTERKDAMYQILGVTAGEKYVYVLRDKVDRYDGTVLGQELMVIDFDRLYGRQRKIFSLDNEDGIRYGWVNASGSTITVIGTDEKETKAIRKNYEFGSVLEDTLSLKNERTYPMRTGEGIYKAIGNGTNLVYISDSGKIYCASEERVYEVYPARTVDTLMYPSFISYAESGYVYFGEYETGNIIRLNLEDGSEETVLSGSSPFGGSNLYTPGDVVLMSMSGLNTFTALVKSGQDDGFHFLVCQDGNGHVISAFRYGIPAMILEIIRQWAVYAAVILVIFGFAVVFTSAIRGGHTIMERLLSATIPLLFITMALFGAVSFQYYKGAIDENFVKQTVDEGNMLAALFGQESFNEIEYPYDYSGEAYSYLSQQLATRELYTRVIYYENGELYIGVDKNSPCFYPCEILMNLPAEQLYRRAALTGESVTGTIHDQLGERMVCITPVGGLSGETVYLLETGIYAANIAAYTATYIKDFTIVSVAFLLIVMVLMMLLFYQILFPLGEMKREMQLFADGDRSIRITSTSEDELTGIAQVFNKMADDIDVQILNLERMSETYYRFVPPSIIGLLGKDNLGSLTLGSNVKGNFAVLNVRLYLEDSLPLNQTEALMNRFFNTVNRFAQQNNIISIVDDANLQSMMLVCQNGADSAAVTALTILARMDADNRLYGPEEQLNVVFVMDQTEVYFGICGDEERYIPAVIAPEFEQLLSNGKFLRSMGSRLLITEAAYERMANKDSYAGRYIGRLEDGSLVTGLYDIYDDRSGEEIRLVKQTQHAFDKAMELYEKGFYYEAKNLLACVLRENPKDMAAKYYIFRCEDLQKKN
ncbi:MAG: HAMP domain-containing protein [Lachnospiraceae bacterium]